MCMCRIIARLYWCFPGLQCPSHDDFIKCKHFPRYWRFVRGIHWWPVNSPQKGQWCGALMFCLICYCAWINAWLNNRKTGNLRRHCAHYDVIVVHTEEMSVENTCTHSVVFTPTHMHIFAGIYCVPRFQMYLQLYDETLSQNHNGLKKNLSSKQRAYLKHKLYSEHQKWQVACTRL